MIVRKSFSFFCLDSSVWTWIISKALVMFAFYNFDEKNNKIQKEDHSKARDYLVRTCAANSTHLE
jgi:hypothetical protein